MNHVHMAIAGLVLWSEKAHNQGRYPQMCTAIANLQAALQAETPRTYALNRMARYRRLQFSTLGPSHRRPTADERPASARQRRPTYRFDALRTLLAKKRDADKTRQQICRMKKEVEKLRAEMTKFTTTRTLGGQLSQE